jgi:hypothetical protein
MLKIIFKFKNLIKKLIYYYKLLTLPIYERKIFFYEKIFYFIFLLILIVFNLLCMIKYKFFK